MLATPSANYLSHPFIRDGYVLALHGSAIGPGQWNSWLDLLPPAIDLLTPGLVGYSRPRTWQAGRAISLADEAEHIEPLLALSPKGVHLIGHSYGGAVALEVARLWPRRIRSLTLYEPARFSVLRAFDPSHWRSVQRLGQGLGLETLSTANERAARRLIEYWSGPGAWDRLTPPVRLRVSAAMPKVQAEFDALFTDLVPLHSWAALRMQVQIISGDCSPIAAQLVARRLAHVIPGAVLSVLEGSGHMAPIFEPAEVLGAMGLTYGTST